MATGKIELELRDATGVKPKPKEGRQVYLKRMHGKIQELEDKGWDKLSNEAQLWANACSTAVDKGTDIPDFPEDEDEAKPSKTEKTAPKKAAGKTTNGKAPVEKVEPKKKAAAEKSEPKSSAPLDGTGIKVQIKKALLKDPRMSVEKLMEKLTKGSDVPSRLTVAGIRAEFRHTLKFLKQEGIEGVKHLEL